MSMTLDGRNTDFDLLEPSVDPATRKLAVRDVKGRNRAGSRTDITVRDFPVFATDEPASLGGTNEAPSPLETVLAGLIGCDGVMIKGCADAMGFAYAGVDFQCQSQIDIRGPKGVPGVRPYFESIDMVIAVYSDEPPERFDRLVRNVEFRCPVMNLMRAADVTLNVDWQQHPAAAFGR